ncbi:hypothetical protein PAMC26510_29435 [Caballeronia sordidicola]|uniref:Uncharacterized protein n=1 Tax=Caballeronia sordidicola TaxID=196367 RepID=A0A242MAB1_CABSO|nr:hypothetical protein PAMC26510_29435 [Caballeronia sordidicola]
MLNQLIGERDPICRCANHPVVKAERLTMLGLKQGGVFSSTLRNERADLLE